MHCQRYSFEGIALDLIDCIGAESCVDLRSDIMDQESSCMVKKSRCRRNQRLERTEKEYPPPIPWLGRTENSPSVHTPWIMRRYYTEDGRLVIKEEKVERREYFQEHRSNGRLTLRLVPLEDDDGLDDDGDEGKDHVEYDDRDSADGTVISERNGFDGESVDDDAPTLLEKESGMINLEPCLDNEVNMIAAGGVVVGGGGRGQCYRYSSMRRNSCMFGGGGGGMAVTAFRPVHT